MVVRAKVQREPLVIDITPYCNADECFDVEILACEIAKHRRHLPLVLHQGDNNYDLNKNGIFKVVDNICNNLSIPHEKIGFNNI